MWDRRDPHVKFLLVCVMQQNQSGYSNSASLSPVSHRISKVDSFSAATVYFIWYEPEGWAVNRATWCPIDTQLWKSGHPLPLGVHSSSFLLGRAEGEMEASRRIPAPRFRFRQSMRLFTLANWTAARNACSSRTTLTWICVFQRLRERRTSRVCVPYGTKSQCWLIFKLT